MKWRNWLENWDMTSLKIKTSFLEMDWNPNPADQEAAWEMYTELLTRITTQPLGAEDGNEQTALESIHSLFETTREIIRRHRVDCMNFTKIAIIVLNQIVRPFTSRWHKRSLAVAFDNPEQCRLFREELTELQKKLIKYTRLLGNMAGVEEDLTKLEDDSL